MLFIVRCSYSLDKASQLAATVTALNNSHTLSLYVNFLLPSLTATSHSATIFMGSACVPAAGVHQQSVDAQHLAVRGQLQCSRHSRII
jgi:hypothetical protein